MIKLDRIYHHYETWEDYINGMWRKETRENEESMLEIAIEFTGDHVRYGNAMMRVLNEWKITCEHNLTDISINRQAFIGHAAVCLELNIPEYITRMAWHLLSDNQRVLANLAADRAIEKFESQYKKQKDAQAILEF